jgi:hypothetical protein
LESQDVYGKIISKKVKKNGLSAYKLDFIISGSYLIKSFSSLGAENFVFLPGTLIISLDT